MSDIQLVENTCNAAKPIPTISKSLREKGIVGKDLLECCRKLNSGCFVRVRRLTELEIQWHLKRSRCKKLPKYKRKLVRVIESSSDEENNNDVDQNASTSRISGESAIFSDNSDTAFNDPRVRKRIHKKKVFIPSSSEEEEEEEKEKGVDERNPCCRIDKVGTSDSIVVETDCRNINSSISNVLSSSQNVSSEQKEKVNYFPNNSCKLNEPVKNNFTSSQSMECDFSSCEGCSYHSGINSENHLSNDKLQSLPKSSCFENKPIVRVRCLSENNLSNFRRQSLCESLKQKDEEYLPDVKSETKPISFSFYESHCEQVHDSSNAPVEPEDRKPFKSNVSVLPDKLLLLKECKDNSPDNHLLKDNVLKNKIAEKSCTTSPTINPVPSKNSHMSFETNLFGSTLEAKKSNEKPSLSLKNVEQLSSSQKRKIDSNSEDEIRLKKIKYSLPDRNFELEVDTRTDNEKIFSLPGNSISNKEQSPSLRTKEYVPELTEKNINMKDNATCPAISSPKPSFSSDVSLRKQSNENSVNLQNNVSNNNNNKENDCSKLKCCDANSEIVTENNNTSSSNCMKLQQSTSSKNEVCSSKSKTYHKSNKSRRCSSPYLGRDSYSRDKHKYRNSSKNEHRYENKSKIKLTQKNSNCSSLKNDNKLKASSMNLESNLSSNNRLLPSERGRKLSCVDSREKKSDSFKFRINDKSNPRARSNSEHKSSSSNIRVNFSSKLTDEMRSSYKQNNTANSSSKLTDEVRSSYKQSDTANSSSKLMDEMRSSYKRNDTANSSSKLTDEVRSLYKQSDTANSSSKLMDEVRSSYKQSDTAKSSSKLTDEVRSSYKQNDRANSSSKLTDEVRSSCKKSDTVNSSSKLMDEVRSSYKQSDKANSSSKLTDEVRSSYKKSDTGHSSSKSTDEVRSSNKQNSTANSSSKLMDEERSSYKQSDIANSSKLTDEVRSSCKKSDTGNSSSKLTDEVRSSNKQNSTANSSSKLMDEVRSSCKQNSSANSSSKLLDEVRSSYKQSDTANSSSKLTDEVRSSYKQNNTANSSSKLTDEVRSSNKQNNTGNSSSKLMDEVRSSYKQSDIANSSKLTDEVRSSCKKSDTGNSSSKLIDEVRSSNKQNSTANSSSKLMDEVRSSYKQSDIANSSKLTDEVRSSCKKSDTVNSSSKLTDEVRSSNKQNGTANSSSKLMDEVRSSCKQNNSANSSSKLMDEVRSSCKQNNSANSSSKLMDEVRSSCKQNSSANSSSKLLDEVRSSYKQSDTANSSSKLTDEVRSSYKQNNTANSSSKLTDEVRSSNKQNNTGNSSSKLTGEMRSSYKQNDIANSSSKLTDEVRSSCKQSNTANSSSKLTDDVISSYKQDDTAKTVDKRQDEMLMKHVKENLTNSPNNQNSFRLDKSVSPNRNIKESVFNNASVFPFRRESVDYKLSTDYTVNNTNSVKSCLKIDITERNELNCNKNMISSTVNSYNKCNNKHSVRADQIENEDRTKFSSMRYKRHSFPPVRSNKSPPSNKIELFPGSKSEVISAAAVTSKQKSCLTYLLEKDSIKENKSCQAGLPVSNKSPKRQHAVESRSEMVTSTKLNEDCSGITVARDLNKYQRGNDCTNINYEKIRNNIPLSNSVNRRNSSESDKVFSYVKDDSLPMNDEHDPKKRNRIQSEPFRDMGNRNEVKSSIGAHCFSSPSNSSNQELEKSDTCDAVVKSSSNILKICSCGGVVPKTAVKSRNKKTIKHKNRKSSAGKNSVHRSHSRSKVLKQNQLNKSSSKNVKRKNKKYVNQVSANSKNKKPSNSIKFASKNTAKKTSVLSAHKITKKNENADKQVQLIDVIDLTCDDDNDDGTETLKVKNVCDPIKIKTERSDDYFWRKQQHKYKTCARRLSTQKSVELFGEDSDEQNDSENDIRSNKIPIVINNSDNICNGNCARESCKVCRSSKSDVSGADTISIINFNPNSNIIEPSNLTDSDDDSKLKIDESKSILNEANDSNDGLVIDESDEVITFREDELLNGTAEQWINTDEGKFRLDDLETVEQFFPFKSSGDKQISVQLNEDFSLSLHGIESSSIGVANENVEEDHTIKTPEDNYVSQSNLPYSKKDNHEISERQTVKKTAKQENGVISENRLSKDSCRVEENVIESQETNILAVVKQENDFVQETCSVSDNNLNIQENGILILEKDTCKDKTLEKCNSQPEIQGKPSDNNFNSEQKKAIGIQHKKPFIRVKDPKSLGITNHGNIPDNALRSDQLESAPDDDEYGGVPEALTVIIQDDLHSVDRNESLFIEKLMTEVSEFYIIRVGEILNSAINDLVKKNSAISSARSLTSTDLYEEEIKRIEKEFNSNMKKHCSDFIPLLEHVVRGIKLKKLFVLILYCRLFAYLYLRHKQNIAYLYELRTIISSMLKNSRGNSHLLYETLQMDEKNFNRIVNVIFFELKFNVSEKPDEDKLKAVLHSAELDDRNLELVKNSNITTAGVGTVNIPVAQDGNNTIPNIAEKSIENKLENVNKLFNTPPKLLKQNYMRIHNNSETNNSNRDVIVLHTDCVLVCDKVIVNHGQVSNVPSSNNTQSLKRTFSEAIIEEQQDQDSVTTNSEKSQNPIANITRSELHFDNIIEKSSSDVSEARTLTPCNDQPPLVMLDPKILRFNHEQNKIILENNRLNNKTIDHQSNVPSNQESVNNLQMSRKNLSIGQLNEATVSQGFIKVFRNVVTTTNSVSTVNSASVSQNSSDLVNKLLQNNSKHNNNNNNNSLLKQFLLDDKQPEPLVNTNTNIQEVNNLSNKDRIADSSCMNEGCMSNVLPDNNSPRSSSGYTVHHFPTGENPVQPITRDKEISNLPTKSQNQPIPRPPPPAIPLNRQLSAPASIGNYRRNSTAALLNNPQQNFNLGSLDSAEVNNENVSRSSNVLQSESYRNTTTVPVATPSDSRNIANCVNNSENTINIVRQGGQGIGKRQNRANTIVKPILPKSNSNEQVIVQLATPLRPIATASLTIGHHQTNSNNTLSQTHAPAYRCENQRQQQGNVILPTSPLDITDSTAQSLRQQNINSNIPPSVTPATDRIHQLLRQQYNNPNIAPTATGAVNLGNQNARPQQSNLNNAPSSGGMAVSGVHYLIQHSNPNIASTTIGAADIGTQNGRQQQYNLNIAPSSGVVADSGVHNLRQHSNIAPSAIGTANLGTQNGRQQNSNPNISSTAAVAADLGTQNGKQQQYNLNIAPSSGVVADSGVHNLRQHSNIAPSAIGTANLGTQNGRQQNSNPNISSTAAVAADLGTQNGKQQQYNLNIAPSSGVLADSGVHNLRQHSNIAPSAIGTANLGTQNGRQQHSNPNIASTAAVAADLGTQNGKQQQYNLNVAPSSGVVADSGVHNLKQHSNTNIASSAIGTANLGNQNERQQHSNTNIAPTAIGTANLGNQNGRQQHNNTNIAPTVIGTANLGTQNGKQEQYNPNIAPSLGVVADSGVHNLRQHSNTNIAPSAIGAANLGTQNERQQNSNPNIVPTAIGAADSGIHNPVQQHGNLNIQPSVLLQSGLRRGSTEQHHNLSTHAIYNGNLNSANFGREQNNSSMTTPSLYSGVQNGGQPPIAANIVDMQNTRYSFQPGVSPQRHHPNWSSGPVQNAIANISPESSMARSFQYNTNQNYQSNPAMSNVRMVEQNLVQNTPSQSNFNTNYTPYSSSVGSLSTMSIGQQMNNWNTNIINQTPTIPQNLPRQNSWSQDFRKGLSTIPTDKVVPRRSSAPHVSMDQLIPEQPPSMMTSSSSTDQLALEKELEDVCRPPGLETYSSVQDLFQGLIVDDNDLDNSNITSQLSNDNDKSDVTKGRDLHTPTPDSDSAELPTSTSPAFKNSGLQELRITSVSQITHDQFNDSVEESRDLILLDD